MTCVSGLTGKTNWEQAQVEQISDTMDDLRAEVAKWIYEKTEDKKVSNKAYHHKQKQKDMCAQQILGKARHQPSLATVLAFASKKSTLRKHAHKIYSNILRL